MIIAREGHMHAMKRVFGYLRSNYKLSIVYNTDKPEFSMHQIKEYDWFPLYGEVKDEIHYIMPVPKGKPVVTSGSFDSSHAICLFTKRSITCVRLFLNKTLITSYCKRKNCVETSTYGSEAAVGMFALDNVLEMRYNLRVLGVTVKGTTILFRENRSI